MVLSARRGVDLRVMPFERVCVCRLRPMEGRELGVVQGGGDLHAAGESTGTLRSRPRLRRWHDCRRSCRS